MKGMLLVLLLGLQRRKGLLIGGMTSIRGLMPIGSWCNVGVDQRLTCAHKSLNSELSGQQAAGIGTGLQRNWNFLGGSRVIIRPQIETFIRRQKASGIQALYISIPNFTS